MELRFKTNFPHGVMFYASGNQGDFLVLQMSRGYLNVSIDLGELEAFFQETIFFLNEKAVDFSDILNFDAKHVAV